MGEVDPDVRVVEREEEAGWHGHELVVEVEGLHVPGVFWCRHGHGDPGSEFVVGFVVAGVGVAGCGVDGCWESGGAGVVADYAERVVPDVVVAAGTLPDGTEPVVSGRSVGFDDDVVALAHGDDDVVGGVRDQRDEVHADDGQLVAVDGEAEVRVETRVYDSKTIFLAGFEVHLETLTGAFAAGVGAVFAVKDVGSVDEG